MGLLNIVLWLGGVFLVAYGYSRARPPWARYQALKDESANAERYNAWRGGVRDDSETGASVAMFLYRRQAQRWGILVIVGVVLIFLGFLIR
jgi:hypothetical protein